MAMTPDEQGIFYVLIVGGGPGAGEFTYDASGNLRSSNVGQVTTDPVQGITCQQGFATYNGHGAVINLLSTSKGAFFQYQDLGTSTQGGLILAVASTSGTDPVNGTAYGAAMTGIDPVFGDFITTVGANINLGQGVYTRNAVISAFTGGGASRPGLRVDAPEQGTASHLQMVLQGASPDGTKLAQLAIGLVSGAGTLIPATAALLEIQGGFAAGTGTSFEIWLLPSGDTTGVADSAAITAAILVAPVIHLLPGTYYVNGQITMTGPKQLLGAGPGITTIKTVAAANQYNVIATPDSAAAGHTSSHGIIKGLTIDCAGMAGGAASNGNGNGLYLFGAIEWLVEDVEIINSPNWAIVLDSNAANDCFWTWLHRVNLGTGTQANAAGILNGYNTNSRISECVLAAKSVATVAAQQPKYTPAPSNVGGVLLSNSADPKHTNNVFGKGGSTVATVAITNIGNHFIGNYFLNSDASVINDVAGNTIIDGNQFDQCVLVTAAPLIQLNGSKANPVTLTGNVQSQGAGLSTWAVQGSGLVKMLANALVAGSTGLTSIEGGDSWNRVGAAGQPAFGANWSNFGGGFAALGFRLVAGPPRTVQIIGTVTAAVGAGATIFTLPADYAPASNHQFCITQLNPATNWLEVLASGAVNLHAATTGTFTIEVILSLDV